MLNEKWYLGGREGRERELPGNIAWGRTVGHPDRSLQSSIFLGVLTVLQAFPLRHSLRTMILSSSLTMLTPILKAHQSLKATISIDCLKATKCFVFTSAHILLL